MATKATAAKVAVARAVASAEARAEDSAAVRVAAAKAAATAVAKVAAATAVAAAEMAKTVAVAVSAVARAATAAATAAPVVTTAEKAETAETAETVALEAATGRVLAQSMCWVLYHYSRKLGAELWTALVSIHFGLACKRKLLEDLQMARIRFHTLRVQSLLTLLCKADQRNVDANVRTVAKAPDL